MDELSDYGVLNIYLVIFYRSDKKALIDDFKPIIR